MEAFREQFYRILEAYVDGVIISKRKKENHIEDLSKTIPNMGSIRLKLKPEKCILRVQNRGILGYLVSISRIEAKPDKINTTINM